MKHPAIQRQPAPASGSEIPWSAELEEHLRRKIRNTWFEMWLILLVGLSWGAVFVVRHHWWNLAIAVVCFGYGVALLYGLALVTEQLGAEMSRGPGGEFFEGSGMLANKPRSTRGLTEWRQHPPDETSFFCECADIPGARGIRWHIWNMDAKWIPNYDPAQMQDAELFAKDVDPGGGRYVILCPCGLGHFKLKA